jgi:hypothetical protein
MEVRARRLIGLVHGHRAVVVSVAVQVVRAEAVELHRPEDVGHPGVGLETEREAAGEIRHGLVAFPRGDPAVAEPRDLADQGLGGFPGVGRIRPEHDLERSRVQVGVEEAADGVGEAQLIPDHPSQSAVEGAPAAEHEIHDLGSVEIWVAPP